MLAELIETVALETHDYPVSVQGRNSVSFLKSELRALIVALPPAGRESLELRFGSPSARAVAEAVDAYDVAELQAIAAHYHFTPAGVDARYLLGTHHFGRRDPLAALATFCNLDQREAERFGPMLSLQTSLAWQQLGNTEIALAKLLGLSSRRRSMSVEIGHSQTTVPTTAEGLRRWLSVDALACLPSHTVEFTLPANPAVLNVDETWPSGVGFFPLSDSLEAALQQGKFGSPTGLPAARPQLVGNRLIFRCLSGLASVDATSGEDGWQGSGQESQFSELIEAVSNQAGDARQLAMRTNLLMALLAERSWDDQCYAQFTADERFVYCIEDRPATGAIIDSVAQHYAKFIKGGTITIEGSPMASNKLRAYDIATGELKREWPGKASDGRLAGCCFLGPPCLLGNSLWTLLEYGEDENGTLAIAEFDRAVDPDIEDSLLWLQPLGSVHRRLLSDPFRRVSGVTPSWSEHGVIVPTNGNRLYCVDPVTRSINWSHEYGIETIGSRPIVIGGVALSHYNNRAILPPNFSVQARSGWSENQTLTAGERLIVTPRENQELRCLNAKTGVPVWDKPVPREESRYVAGIVNEEILLIGDQFVRAISLASGIELWRASLPREATLAGRGMLIGDKYWLPLNYIHHEEISVGQIAILDTARQQIVLPEHVGALRFPLGNLILSKLGIYSQDEHGIRRLTIRDQ